MTLCIAAECEYREKPAIALCSDWRGQTGDANKPDLMIGSDDTGKMREVRNATVMLAGNSAKAIELASACKTVIRDFVNAQIDPEDVDFAVSRFMQQLRQVAADKKTELIRNLVQNSTGLTHSEFVKLATEQHTEVWHSIRQTNLGADLLISFVSHEAIIVRLDRWGEAHWEQNYGVIGNGAEIARAMLCLQMWTPAKSHTASSYTRTDVPLEECLFRIYEAHLAAHRANPSSVGDVNTFQVLRETYRASVNRAFLDHINQLATTKHRVPEIAEARGKNQLLRTCQSFATGDITPSEPEELYDGV